MRAILNVRNCLLLTLASASVAALALAKDPHPGDVNAALHARDQMLQTHRQTGAFTGGYRPYSAYSYTQAAVAHADALNSYGGVQQVPVETAQEHLDEIKRNIAASSKEVKKLDADSAQKANVHELAKSIQAHNAAADQAASSAQEEIKKTGSVNISSSPHYQTMSHELNAAASAHRQMLKTLGIEGHGTLN